MKRLIFLLVMLVLSSVLFADYNKSDLDNQFNMALFPYNGSNNINLRNVEGYPVRNEDTVIKHSEDYFDYHMIAHGIIEGIPMSEGGDWINGLLRYHIVYDEVPSMTVSFSCSNDFMFVSQSDSSYRRPFYLYLLPKSARGDEKGYSAYPDPGTKPILINGNVTKPIEFDPPETSGDWGSIWFDIIIALPGVMDDNGVTVDNIYYPLSDNDDYTAEVSITISWELTCDVERAGLGGQWWTKAATDQTVSFSRTITLPFSGYCSFEEPTESESVGSLYISTTTESQNINLNPDFIEPVKVADISYLYNFGHGTQIGNVSEDVNKSWLFLSASPDPWSNSDSNIFRMYHVSAGSDADEYNSIPFMVYVEEVNGAKNQYVEFLGNNDAYDFTPTGKGTSDNFIETEHHNDQSRFPYGNTDTQYYHYHSFEGEVWVEVMPQTDLMAAGRYIGDIYVHVIVEA